MLCGTAAHPDPGDHPLARHSGMPPAKHTNRPWAADCMPASGPPGLTSGASSWVRARWATALYALSGASTGPAISAPSMRSNQTRWPPPSTTATESSASKLVAASTAAATRGRASTRSTSVRVTRDTCVASPSGQAGSGGAPQPRMHPAHRYRLGEHRLGHLGDHRVDGVDHVGYR